jgi:hypothetical protein
MKGKFYTSREWYIPKNATKVSDKQSDAIAYLSINSRGKPRATIFYGQQAKPVSDYYYATDERRSDAVARAFESRRQSLARKNERRQQRKDFVHTAQVGDIYRTSWGYDQTNVEYFQIVEVKGKHAVLREIGAESVDTCHDQGRCIPLKDAFLKPRYDGDDQGLPIRRLIQDGHIKIDDVRYAWPVKTSKVAGIELVTETHYWSTGH